ncbi:hypothetical protein I4U23_016526 [Adineta vaga]|nr:hypothetical protein I4U23_016526 [Adineta vaga]
MDDYRITFKAEPSDKVEQLKIKIENILNLHSNQQRLIFCGHNLQNDRLLSDYNIINESEILLVYRFPCSMMLETAQRFYPDKLIYSE